MRISLILKYVVLSLSLSIPIAIGQDLVVMNGGGTLRGHIIDTSPKQKPLEGVRVEIKSPYGEEKIFTVHTDKNGEYKKKGLPKGRYTISTHKKGYSSRVGKSTIVTSGEERYVLIKMRKKDTIFSRFYNRIIHQSNIYLAALRRISSQLSKHLAISQ